MGEEEEAEDDECWEGEFASEEEQEKKHEITKGTFKDRLHVQFLR